MANQLRVAVDVGSQFHQVAIGDGSGRLLEEFRVDHRNVGFEHFFERIDRYRSDDVRVAMEGYNGWARPLGQQVLDRRWRLRTIGVRSIIVLSRGELTPFWNNKKYYPKPRNAGLFLVSWLGCAR